MRVLSAAYYERCMMEAILYSRWSSLEQGNGTSSARQQELCANFASQQGWHVSERQSDEGKSAWTGDNIKTGNLGKLAQRFTRHGATGTVIVVEKLDRLSRRPAPEMVVWIQQVLATGLTIATADGRHLLTAERWARDPIMFFSVVFEAFRANDEGQVKSERVATAWRKKRERGAPMTKRCPAWLRPRGSTSIKADQLASTYEVIPDRGKLVRWVFRQSAAGVGAATIAALLNARGESVWGNGDGWHSSYIKKILSNRAVIGEYQPCTRPKGAKRVPAGDPLPNYFPEVVPVELFMAVNDLRAQRVKRQQSGHNPLVNLLAGLARCNHCGGTMTFLDKGTETLADGRLADRKYLKCSRVHRSLGGCDNRRSYNYLTAERCILDELLHLAMDDQHFANDDGVAETEAELGRLRWELDEAKRRQERAMELIEADPADELAMQRYRHHKEQAQIAKTAVKEAENLLAEARGQVTPAEHIKRVAEVRDMLADSNAERRYQARLRVKLALNDLIETIAFSNRTERVWVRLVGSVRHMAFDLTGNKIGDREWPNALSRLAGNPVVDGYVRRRA